ncbi:putative secreted protein (Por secretion system target) [Aquimarina sp. MAR_2010_214]|uniref:T9SS type A sorting domain-containing protein n=1 Tax=Aquimarina sp. MAR_2010_214 TaxID=1250026 RepID=UPI000C70C497|nr:T9SS type A sorting domain-containing protein [Aquimarina sp. MAR_2010_214]PKV48745.1 putative secreted protein (Por secretion system target) [Aquimarina sp. MAR_2010_214]
MKKLLFTLIIMFVSSLIKGQTISEILRTKGSDIIESKDIIVFPTHIANGEKLTVLAKGYEYFDVLIYDLHGNLIIDSKNVSTKVNLDISKFLPGMYIVKVNKDSDEFIKKIIVAK